MEEKNFEREYQAVFDENDEIKACGRNACIVLMQKMEEVFPGETFGNTETGFMDVFKIRRFHRKANR